MEDQVLLCTHEYIQKIFRQPIDPDGRVFKPITCSLDTVGVQAEVDPKVVSCEPLGGQEQVKTAPRGRQDMVRGVRSSDSVLRHAAG